jgi:hypothetical protein
MPNGIIPSNGTPYSHNIMRFAAFVFLLTALTCNAQTEAVFTVKKAVADTTQKITPTQSFSFRTTQTDIILDTTQNKTVQDQINKILGLPPGQTVISCDVYLSSKGEVSRGKWSINNQREWADIKWFMDNAKPKDKLTFANIFVMKDAKTIMVRNKTIEY